MIATAMRSVKLRDAIKSRNKVASNLYKYLLARFDHEAVQPCPDDTAIAIMRSVLKEANEPNSSFTSEEIQLLRSLVPAALDVDQTRKFLVDQGIVPQIAAAPAEGMAMGMAMKAFRQGQRLVDGNTVLEVVRSLRTAQKTG